MTDTLIVMALEMESRSLLEKEAGHNVLYTGVGKVNAAYALGRELARREAAGKKPALVLNLGTAGSKKFPRGSMVACHRFTQRDMDVSMFGFPVGTTPFEDHIPATIEHAQHFSWLPHAACSSGDGFVSTLDGSHAEVVDMEAFALAKVCHLEKVPFASVKYITDGADDAAPLDWQQSLDNAAKAFLAFMRELAQRPVVA